ncbi:MAG TPA: class III extradiol dioxygenase subunit B-like domain-containing protein, partial [Candidatus Limnocylindrales bacterium]|nr:class III extradiol dioxygenase subunit B-like domain-containing protein [Candidatus Limnocylindrales bacterium]
MLSIIGVAPHPPLIIPAIGRTELSKVERTVEGMQVLCRRIKEAKPEILIIITPHGRIAREGPTVLTDDQLTGHFGRFGFPEIRIAFQTDKYLIELLESETATESIKPVLISGREHSIHGGEALDHGAMVPLYYLQQAGVSVPGLHLTIGLQPYHMLYQFGRSLRRAVEKRGLPAAVLAS